MRSASAPPRLILPQGTLGYFQRALAVPGRVIEQKPKTSFFVLSLLLAMSLATHGLTVNPFQRTAQVLVVTVSTNQPVYQPGSMVFITVTVSQPVKADVIWVFLEQPNNVSNYFQMLPPSGGTVNVTLAMDAPLGQWFAVAHWGEGLATRTGFTVTAATPVPEFPSSFMVLLLALAVVINSIHGRKTAPSSTAHQFDPSPPLLC